MVRKTEVGYKVINVAVLQMVLRLKVEALLKSNRSSEQKS